ncbi:MAG: DUF47 family protein [Clostridiales bacterium]|nr:DUF47 family protein [Clostridiales bacterium]
MAKKNNPYYDDFIKMANYAFCAAEYLHTALEDFRPETLPERRRMMHEIEHEADKVKHKMMRRLVKEFVTPIDREDIILLANKLDDVTDRIDEVITRMYMYNVKRIREGAMTIVDVIMRSCDALQTAMIEFPNFQKSTLLSQVIVDVNSMEEEGDACYIRAVRQLYSEHIDPIETMAWSELFEVMEACCDACEHVVDAMEIIIMKNS